VTDSERERRGRQKRRLEVAGLEVTPHAHDFAKRFGEDTRCQVLQALLVAHQQLAAQHRQEKLVVVHRVDQHLDHPAHLALEAVDPFECLAHAADSATKRVLQHFQVQLFLVGEVVVKRGRRDAAGLGKIPHRGGVVALGCKQRRRLFEDVFLAEAPGIFIHCRHRRIPP
jgi:prolyl-tRNA editing enzyme YbaK/EbsC (Cys-tRNA(Pro) deacylase)